MSKKIEKLCPITRVGHEKNEFFGYYNKTCFDTQDKRILALQSEFKDALIEPSRSVDVGYFQGKSFIKLDSTKAWNFQMGSQLQWLGDERIIYNTRGEDDSYQACLLDIKTGQKTYYQRPLYSLAPRNDYYLSVNYDRLYITHKTIGYPRLAGPLQDLALAPKDDGIFRVDIKSRESRLLLSYQDLFDFHHEKSMEKALHWVSHIEINPSSRRVLFLHRWSERVEDEFCFIHRLITMDEQGGKLRLLEDGEHPIAQLEKDFDPSAQGIYDYEKSDWQISHPMWKNDKEIIVWGPHAGHTGYQLYEDEEAGRVELLSPSLLSENGHMSYSPVNERFLLTDTYPNEENIRELLIYDCQEDILYVIARLYVPQLIKENRCDLHPRWSHDGLRVCIDSVHEDCRGMYLLDVSSVVA